MGANEETAAGLGLRTHTVFTHVVVPKAPLYRTILETFVRAREQFTTHLRPGEIAALIGRDEEETQEALEQLEAWDNLEATQDSAEAAFLEEFYRSRFLYALSAPGEAAERALGLFEETLHQPGELQTAALHDVSDYLDAIARLLSTDAVDVAKLHTQLLTLNDRFASLTLRAQAFMRDLQSTIQLHGISVEQFLAYKGILIDYLEKFLGDLVLAANDIAQKIVALEELGIGAQLARVAERASSDVINRTPEHLAEETGRWEGRWRGFRRWFLGEPGKASQAEILRGRAREAVPALLFTLQNINDQRVTKSDRFTDWQTLALWFAEAETEADAHRLWRAAFAMAPTRHLQINHETIERRDQADEAPRVSWLRAEPIWISPRLRVNGRIVTRSQPAAVIDQAAARRELARQTVDEAAQIRGAQRVLARGRPMRLSDFGDLDPAAFDLLLELLGEALAVRVDPREACEVTSMDGALLIRLSPAGENDAPVEIRTSSGSLFGRDCEVTVRYTDDVEPAPSIATPSAHSN